jgi:hypothetical protein
MVRRLAFLVIGCGILLHAYTAFFKAAGPVNTFLLGLMLWSWLPYVGSAVLLRVSKSAHAALGAALFALGADVAAFYSAFIHPTSSTAALGLLFMPLWNLLFFAPVGALLGWLISKRAPPAEESAP